jgi:hypothetical protein
MVLELIELPDLVPSNISPFAAATGVAKKTPRDLS